jgi:hypothetical protein
VHSVPLHDSQSAAERVIAYQKWEKARDQSVLISTYTLGIGGYDFSKASQCVFVQDPWIEITKSQVIGGFIPFTGIRTHELEVMDVAPESGVSTITKDFTRRGFKLSAWALANHAKARDDDFDRYHQTLVKQRHTRPWPA